MSATETAHDHRKSTIIAVLLTCVAYAYFNIGDAALKMLGAKFHFSQILFLNCIVILGFMAVYGWVTDGKRAFVMRQPKWVLARGLLTVIVAVLNTYALPNVELTTFYTVVFTSPFWVALLSALFLKERLERRRLGVILAGFAVVLFIFRPGGGSFDIWTVFVLLSAFVYSCSMVVTRYMGPQESRTMIVSVGSVLCILLSLPFLQAHYISPTPYEWGLFFMMGIVGAIGITCIAYAFQNAPSAAAIAPYHYTQIIWGALLGYFLFNEVPDMRTMVGAALIILAGLYLVYGETRRPVLRGSGV